ncbi:hypothetical protein MtrunA17_Chr1g0148761 [Medicago truncatula]|uniref:Transmembrane protein n=1 Tax=Medicago truncatula TaxID=3880 RepID=A0A396JKN7_MEDTR|nr:hypothetical protein MtrunA17_Chr1g0148761 [Medicago truncatula]
MLMVAGVDFCGDARGGWYRFLVVILPMLNCALNCRRKVKCGYRSFGALSEGCFWFVCRSLICI